MSKTKDNADHAGPSLQLVFLKEKSDLLAIKLFFLNNNLLTAPLPKETGDAMEDGIRLLGTTSLATVLLLQKTIHMLVKTSHAKLKEVLRDYLLTLMQELMMHP